MKKGGLRHMEFNINKNPYAIRANQLANLHQRLTQVYCEGNSKYTMPRMLTVSNKLYLHICKMNEKTIEFEKQLLLKD